MSMTKIAEITVGSTPSLIQLTSIPQTYTDLMVTFSLRTNNNAFLGIYFNGSTSGYTSRQLMGNGTSASSFSRTDYYANDTNHPGLTANTFGNGTLYIPNYAGSTNKSFSVDHIQEANQSDAKQTLDAGLWSNTAAITSITFDNYIGGTFVQNSTVTLYGISKVPAAGIQPKATGGDVYQTGSYTYHVFKSSGTFTPTVAIPNAEMLVIAGGGGGGANGSGGGGGGAGGLLVTGFTNISSSQTVTVGAGGTAAYDNTVGANGGNSSVGSLATAVGGGRGGQGQQAGVAGGSGGGAGGFTSLSGGSATSGQGYAGGNGPGASGLNYTGSGGGGAGAVGVNSNTGTGDGGAGLNTYSAWAYATGSGSNGYYAGGGGGGDEEEAGGPGPGSGGVGGGGQGQKRNVRQATSGSTNTGSGGGGGGGTYPQAGSGGSGIVIIRYA